MDDYVRKCCLVLMTFSPSFFSEGAAFEYPSVPGEI
jgi:hypothetical protein